MKDIIVLNKINKNFTEFEQEEIVSIICSDNSTKSEDLEKVKLFFTKLKVQTDDLWSVILEFSSKYDLEMSLIIPFLKKTNLVEVLKSEREKSKNKEFLKLF